MVAFYFERHQVFTQIDFFPKFCGDLNKARFLVIIQSPFLSERRIEMLRRFVEACIVRGVRVCFFVQRNEFLHSPDDLQRLLDTDKAAKLLLDMGAHVTFRPEVHEKLIIIDDCIAWEGTMNVFSYRNTTERMTRWESRGKVLEIMETHRLYSCSTCCARIAGSPEDFRSHPPIGELIAQRRKVLGMTQRELARQAGLAQSVVSEIERGCTDVRLSSLERILSRLHLGWRTLPQHMICSIDDLIGMTEEDRKSE